jgi:hypothetical protein
LALGDRPVGGKEAVFFGARNEGETVALIEANGPDGIGPCADQHGSGGAIDQRAQELGTYTAALMAGCP